jgi:DNA replication and repair protein RecF
VDISVDYVISQKNHLHSTAQQLYDTMSQRAQELLSSEMQSGITLVGPHKHEIQFLIDQNDSRFFCSQGQQRAFILAFKMAQIVYHERLHKQSPILLLDDVMSELDLDKQRFLMEFLQQSSSQIIVTTTDAFLPQRFWGDDGYLFNIRNGSIQTQ